MNTRKPHRYAGFTNSASVKLRDDLVKNFERGEKHSELIIVFATVREAVGAADKLYSLHHFIASQSWWKRFILRRLMLPKIQSEIQQLESTHTVI